MQHLNKLPALNRSRDVTLCGDDEKDRHTVKFDRLSKDRLTKIRTKRRVSSETL